MAGEIETRNGELFLRFHPADASFSVRHGPSGREFRFGKRGFFTGVTLEDRYGERRRVPIEGRPDVRLGEGVLTARYRGLGGGTPGMDLRLSFRIEGEDLLLEADLNDQAHPDRFIDLFYPGPAVPPKSSDAYVVVPAGQGFLVRGDCREESDGTAGWKPRLGAYHVFDGKTGVTALLETPDDVLLPLSTGRAGVGLWTRWLASHDRFAYPRRIRFRFREGAGYVEAARLVRKAAEEKGFAVTLDEKAAANPAVKKLAGAGIVSDYVLKANRRAFERSVRTFEECLERFRELRRVSGLSRWVYHLDAWPAYGYDHFHPDVLPPAAEAGGAEGLARLARAVKRTGSLFLLHDNYNLYFLDALSFTPRDAVWTRDMEPVRNTHHNGGTNSILCPERALKYIRRNYLEGKKEGRNRFAPIMDVCSPTATYLDQYFISGGQNEECRNPEHPLTRSQYRKSMLKVMEFMRSRLKMVTSNEHIYDFAVPVTDFAGSCGSLAFRTPLSQGVPVPFFSLVFHDCLCFTLPLFGAGAKEPARQTAELLLLGAMPYLFLDYTSDPETLRGAFLLARSAAPVFEFHRKVWNLPHSEHRLLSPDGSVQESVFGDVSVRVDLESGRFFVADGREKTSGRLSTAPQE